MHAVRKRNFDTVLKFELLYNLLLSLVVLPLIKLMFSLTLRYSGLNYLTPNHILAYLKQPINIAAVLFILLLVTCATVWEINALHLVYIESQKGMPLRGQELFLLTLQHSRHFFHNLHPLFFLYGGILLSLSGIIYENPLLKNAELPLFMVDAFSQKPTTLAGFLLVLTGTAVFFYTNVYTFQSMLTEKCAYGSAWRNSRRFIAKTRRKTIRWLLKCIGTGAIVMLVTVSFSNFAVWVLKTIQNPVVLTPLATLLFLSNLLLSLVATCFLKLLYICESNAIYFQEHPLPENLNKLKHHIQIPVPVQITAALLATLTIGASIAVLWVFGEVGSLAVMAHRGSSIEALENTEAAFRLAMDEGAEYLELDVVETKDHKLVMIHDLDLVRLAGVDKQICNLTLAELQQLSIHSPDGKKNGRIMALPELLPMIRPNVILNIELKPNGQNDSQIAQEVESILSDSPQHMVCSFSSEALKQIKKLNPNRKTGLIVDRMPEQVADVPFADFYSVEHSLISADLVHAIHQTGKQVFVWTVNDTALMPAYFSYGVDGIITDHPNEMKKAILTASLNFNSHALERLFLS